MQERRQAVKIAFYTLGCKVNQYETQILRQLFSANGFTIVDVEQPADIFVINSCTVTSSGDKKTRQMMHRFKRKNPGAVIALTGCFPQAFPDAAKLLPEADVITGAYNRRGLLEAVLKACQTGERVVDITPHQRGESFEEMSAGGFLERTRAYVKIEDGCERYCAYCIIPKARGPVRSKPISSLVEELTELAQAGYREVVLVGINLPSYGKELGLRLIDAVEVAASVEGIERIRLGSLEPELLSEEDIERMSRIPKLCPQFHLALQSGSDATLKRMNRHYDCAEYARIADSLRRHFDNASITTDLMVGFPGETEEDFLVSAAFVKKMELAKVHVFAYSVREGTRAAAMPDQIPQNVKEERSRRMIETCKQTRFAFLQAQVGKTCRVLFEQSSADGTYQGYSENYTPVHVRSENLLHGKILPVKITGISEDGDSCFGELV